MDDNEKTLARIERRLEVIDDRTTRLDKTLCGNGKPGLIDEFNQLKQQHQIVYERQKNCISSRKQSKIDFKWVALFIVTVFALVKEFFIK